MVATMIKYVLAATLLTTTDAFVPPSKNVATTFTTSSDLPKLVTSHSELAAGKKDVSEKVQYDEETGRFFESDQVGECQPDEFCPINEATGKAIRLTLAEKERIFLDSLQSYYVNGRQLLKDDEFDLLKEDLSWNGSKLVQMNRNEAKYMSAMEAYTKGAPIMSDEEFDALKATLKEEKSQFAVSKEPKCYIDTGICTVTWDVDQFRSNLLYLPVGLILSLVWIGVSFELIEPFIRINPLILFAIGSVPITVLTKEITENYIFVKNKILYGPCPSCEVEERIYFGDVFGVEGYGATADTKCKKCKAKYSVQRNSMRASTLPK